MDQPQTVICPQKLVTWRASSCKYECFCDTDSIVLPIIRSDRRTGSVTVRCLPPRRDKRREDTLRQGQNVTASSCASSSPSHVWCLALSPSTSAEAFKEYNLCTFSHIYPKYSAPFYYSACEMMDFFWSTPYLSCWNPSLSNLLVSMSWCPLSIALSNPTLRQARSQAWPRQVGDGTNIPSILGKANYRHHHDIVLIIYICWTLWVFREACHLELDVSG